MALPNPHQQLQKECLELFEAGGLEIDHYSRHIIDFFFSAAEQHVSLRDIEEHLRHKSHRPDLDRISRTMQILVDYGFAVERQFPDGRPRYEHLHIGEHHDHLYCLRCGTIVEFFSPELEHVQEQAAAAHGFHAFTHRLLVRGLCRDCFESRKDHLLVLSEVQAGGRFRVVRVEEPGRTMGIAGGRRLSELGLVRGAEGEVLSNFGALLVVQLGGARTVLRQSQTKGVRVELLN
jgi:Fur family ferric uptake transcriptional regulator